MQTLKTSSGKPFRYKGTLEEELIVYPSDHDGQPQDKSASVVTPFVIALVKNLIEQRGRILMGACRDNPPAGSLGFHLREEGQSPQLLSYLIPVLAQAGFCRVTLQGKAFLVERGRN